MIMKNIVTVRSYIRINKMNSSKNSSCWIHIHKKPYMNSYYEYEFSEEYSEIMAEFL